MIVQTFQSQIRNEILKPINPLRMKCYPEVGEWLWKTGIMNRALQSGDLAPDFLLPDERGHLVWSRELLLRGPLVMTFFCGGWCSLSVAKVKALDAAAIDFHLLGASVVAVTAETSDLPRTLKRRENLHLTILSDVDYGVGIDFGALFSVPTSMKAELLELGVDLCARHGSAECMLPVPVTYVIDRTGLISAVFFDVDFAAKTNPDVIVNELRRLGAFSPTN
jgi:peroxiredoxin